MVNQGKVGKQFPSGKKREGCVDYPERSHGRLSPKSLKNSDGRVGRNKVYHEKSAEVVVGTANTEGPNVCIVLITMSKYQTVRNRENV